MSPQFGGGNFILRVDVVDCASASGRPPSILHRTEVCAGVTYDFSTVQCYARRPAVPECSIWFTSFAMVRVADGRVMPMPMAVWRWLGILHIRPISEPQRDRSLLGATDNDRLSRLDEGPAPSPDATCHARFDRDLCRVKRAAHNGTPARKRYSTGT